MKKETGVLTRRQEALMNFLWEIDTPLTANEMAGKLKITLVKSTIGAIPKHRKTVEALGLKKVNKTVEMPDNAATRGQIQQIRHLVKVEEI